MTATKEFYQMTMDEQLLAARTAYLVRLGEDEETAHIAVYLDIEGQDELKCLWPRTNEELLPYQIYADMGSEYPAYHFEVDCLGMSRTAELARILRQSNPDLKVIWLNGGIPSNC